MEVNKVQAKKGRGMNKKYKESVNKDIKNWTFSKIENDPFLFGGEVRNPAIIKKYLKWIILSIVLSYFLMSYFNMINEIELLIVLKVKNSQSNK
jgi:hypothetical protein